MSLSLPKCDFCQHYHDERTDKMCCDAFPEGIPLDVMTQDEDVECADGIKYEEN